MPEEQVVKQRAPKSQQKKPVVRKEHNRKSRKYLLEEVYDIKTPLGRSSLVKDADGLTAAEKSVLFVLAVTCGGTGVGFDPELAYPSNKTVAGGSAQSVSVVKEVWKSLGPGPKGKCLIDREKIDGTLHTRVLWQKFFPMSYRWRAMLAVEAEKGGSPEIDQDIDAGDDAIVAALTKPSAKTIDEDDEIISGLDAPRTPKAEPAAPSISPDLKKYLDSTIKALPRKDWVAYPRFEKMPPFSIEEVRAYCKPFGLTVDDAYPFLRIALPLHEYAAKRLSAHTGRIITPSSLTALHKKEALDPYCTIDHALSTPSWANLLKTAKGAGMLISLWDRIEESMNEGNSEPAVASPTQEEDDGAFSDAVHADTHAQR
jgi:hypothetical protein